MRSYGGNGCCLAGQAGFVFSLEKFFLHVKKFKKFAKILENFSSCRGVKKAFFALYLGSKMFPVPFSFLSTPPYGPLGGVKTKTYMCCLDSKKGLFLPKKAKKQVEKWPFLAKKVFDHVHKNVCSEKNKNTHFFF